jgi:hypothetical protein
MKKHGVRCIVEQDATIARLACVNWTTIGRRTDVEFFSLKRAGSRGLDFLDVAHRAAQA